MKNLESPPRTMMEVYKTLPEGTLAELINDQLHMSPSPNFDHQDIVLEIATRLRIMLKDKANVSIAPFDVYLDEASNAVQPDVVVILNSNKGILNRKGHFHGVPDIVVEVLSPGNKEYDLVKKKELYLKFRVSEYWIIDPDTKQAMNFILENNQYKLSGQEIASITSSLLGVSIAF